MILDELTRFSNYYGKNNDLVLAGGGNTSAKQGNMMYIKASGTALATIKPEGFVKMDRALLAKMQTAQYSAQDSAREAQALEDLMAARMPGEEHKRPSVETTLHALFPQTFVLHLHPAMVNGLTCGIDGEKIATELFGDDFIWVDLYKPGYILSKLCDELMKDYTARTGKVASMLILQNHGIFVAGDSIEQLDKLLSLVISKLESKIRRTPDMLCEEETTQDAEKIKLKAAHLYAGDSYAVFDMNNEARRFAQSIESAAPLLRPFTPDHIVYCKAYPVFVRSVEKLADTFATYTAKHGYLPKIIIVQGLGFCAVGENEKDALTAQMLFNDAIKVAVYSESFGGALHMTQELIDFIVHWEVEAYRQKQN